MARAALGYVVAGGFGAMVGASTATTKTVAKKLDDLSVVVTYNDLSRAYLTFKFGKNRTDAEQLYQIFTVVGRRNQTM
ncbi:MAG: hypothetical protein LUD27_08055 [Clostridia bacterium]|nr:hypothetical protein [Clostridia bacterium]